MFGSKSILAVVKYILRIEKSIEAHMYNFSRILDILGSREIGL